MMKKHKIIIWAAALFLSLNAMAQDDWTPSANVTGYVNVVGEWTNLSTLQEMNKETGIGLSEAGFLASYKPIEQLEIKTTLVYTHKMATFQDMLVEAYGKYTFNRGFAVSAGKFLTPLSPVNVYFYAPLNPSGALPMLISHHFLTPQSISGLQISGVFGEDFQAGYNLAYGSYTTLGHMKQGLIGLIGSEDQSTLPFGAASENPKQNYDLGGSARIYADYKGMFSLGANYFQGTRATLAYGIIDVANPAVGVTPGHASSIKHSGGLDVHFDYDGMLKFNGEFWKGTNTTNDLDDPIRAEFTGYYGEVIFNKGWFSPYLRYEYLDDFQVMGKFINIPAHLSDVMASQVSGSIELNSFGGGLAIRPIYEIMLKLDYRRINSTPDEAFKNFSGAEEESYDHFMVSLVVSF